MNQILDPAQLPLRDIHLPAVIGLWPPAVGWWLLGAMLVALLAGFGVRLYLQRRHRAACRRLQALLLALHNGEEPLTCVQQASIVLRRFAMTMGRAGEQVAGLAGKPWIEYLIRRAPKLALDPRAARALLELPYLPPEKVTVEQAAEYCRVCAAWVRAQPART